MSSTLYAKLKSEATLLRQYSTMNIQTSHSYSEYESSNLTFVCYKSNS